VEFVELQREEASVLVEEYNREGKAALPPQEKRFRQDNRDGGRFGECLFLARLKSIPI
jgi:hypothetical protein